jgi:hypothetical protein
MFHVSIRTKYSHADSSWSAIPNNSLVQRLHAVNDSMRWIAVFTLQGEEHRIALGSPNGIMGNLELSLPDWFLESSGLSVHADTREEIIVRFLPCEGMTGARKLRFKTLEPLPDWLDVRDVLEEPLSQLGVIKQGQVLPIPVLDSTVLILDSAEPVDDFLFLDGDGIEIDVFMDGVEERGQETAPEVPAPEVPAPEVPQVEDFSFLPPQPFVPAAAAAAAPQGFVPFSGKGHTLGTGKPVWDR